MSNQIIGFDKELKLFNTECVGNEHLSLAIEEASKGNAKEGSKVICSKCSATFTILWDSDSLCLLKDV